LHRLGALSIGILLAILLAHAGPAAAQDSQAGVAELHIGYITELIKPRPPLSLVDKVVTDDGVQGARLGIQDSNTTGAFVKQHFVLDEIMVPEGGDVSAAFKQAVAKGLKFFVADLPAARLVAIADLPEGHDTLIFNAQAKDDNLRGEQCRANVLHTMPNRAMLTDALAQYLMWKQWREWFLLAGTGEGDKLFADAVRRSAKKFGAKIVEDQSYNAGSTSRRTDTGATQIQKQLPVLTQASDYDVVIVADESDLFGEYLPYRTWLPRPVAGTQGLVPTAWSRTHEQWGATQFQNRFERFANRWMTERDYAAWLAVRSVTEAATRTKSIDYATLNGFIRGADFSVAGFKGQKLTFRDWDGQMRQPILLTAPRSLVSVSPQEGYLHEFSELDTMGFDRPDTVCKLQ
jgi:ABC transporter substrate binding protein (PQQ-dependent alcohol dehydrogenase system)